MTAFDSQRSGLLQPGVRRREVMAWAGYDFANSGYVTVVITAVFNAYFVGVVAADAHWATFAWTVALAVSNLSVTLLMPGLGAWADRHAAKTRLMALATVGCVVSTAALYLCGAGDVALAMGLVAFSNFCFAVGEAVAAAFLPELARPSGLGQISGWAWGFGFFGGMLSLGLGLAWVLSAPSRGQTGAEAVPTTMLIVAVLFALASLPTFLVLRERSQARTGGESRAMRQVIATLSRARAFPDFWRLLACGTAYFAGISVVIAISAIYAEQAMGFSREQTMMLIFLVNIAAALGAFVFGHVQDRLGHKRTLAITLWGWLVMGLMSAFAQGPTMFWAAAVIAGLCMGSSQSCGRALAAYLIPPGQLAEFFGLWTLATRLSAVIGPLVYGGITWMTQGNHRIAILVTGVSFVLGLWLLRGIDVERGHQQALRAARELSS
ncbi:MAG: MFS transporter [Burkholderiaceae bacterium]